MQESKSVQEATTRRLRGSGAKHLHLTDTSRPKRLRFIVSVLIFGRRLGGCSR